jgi:hypothetical protein
MNEKALSDSPPFSNKRVSASVEKKELLQDSTRSENKSRRISAIDAAEKQDCALRRSSCGMIVSARAQEMTAAPRTFPHG